MAAFTGILRSITSDLSPFSDENRVLKDAIASVVALTISLDPSELQQWGFITESGVPNNAFWEHGGTWTVEYQSETPSLKITGKCRCVRLTKDGTILETGSWTATQVLDVDRTFTPTNPNWNRLEEAADNRLAIEFEFHNNDVGVPRSCGFYVNTINNEVITNISSDLTWTNIEASGNLYTKGYIDTTGSINFYINGHINFTDSIDLYLKGCEHTVNSINLYTKGYIDTTISCTLYSHGHNFLFASGNLFISGSGIIPENNKIVLFTNGYEPKPVLACPILDPTASIQIKDSLIRIYQSRIDALINQLGKNVYLKFDPIREPCVNCKYDTIRKRSTGIYKPGGPKPFSRGRRCPYCKGRGFKETPVNKCIKCLIKWNPKDAENFGIAISQTKGIVRLKTYLTEADDLIRAKTIIVNHDIINQMKLKVKLIQGPIPVGLREDRYCISFWELI